MSSALTMPGEFHLASPREAFDQSPGSTEFEIAQGVLVEALAGGALHEAALLVGLERLARLDPLVERRRRLDLVLVEETLVDPQHAGVVGAHVDRLELSVERERLDSGRGDLRRPVGPERLHHGRTQVLGEGPVPLHVGAGLVVEDVRAAVRSQGRRDRGLPVGDRDELEVDLDVRIFLVERLDVGLGRLGGHGRPAPPVHGARRGGAAFFALALLFLLASLAAATYRATARAQREGDSCRRQHGE
jgi:hypothetical protein